MGELMKGPGRSVLVLLIFMMCLGTIYSSASRAEEHVYSVGVVPQFDVRRLHLVWQPILAELEKRTGYKFKLVGSANIPTFEKQFDAGEFDFAYMNPYHFIKANGSQGYLPLVRDHGRVLQGILVVRSDSPIQDLKQLDGEKIAFPAPNALGASLLMRANLIEEHGLNFEPNYVKSHSSVYLNVLTGRTAAGGGVQGTLNQQSADIRNQLRVVYRTKELATHPIAVHPRVSQEVRDKVQSALLGMGTTSEGQAMLQKVPIRQPGSALTEDYLLLRQIGLERYYVEG